MFFYLCANISLFFIVVPTYLDVHEKSSVNFLDVASQHPVLVCLSQHPGVGLSVLASRCWFVQSSILSGKM
jgi:hypothetical protein